MSILTQVLDHQLSVLVPEFMAESERRGLNEGVDVLGGQFFLAHQVGLNTIYNALLSLLVTATVVVVGQSLDHLLSSLRPCLVDLLLLQLVPDFDDLQMN